MLASTSVDLTVPFGFKISGRRRRLRPDEARRASAGMRRRMCDNFHVTLAAMPLAGLLRQSTVLNSLGSQLAAPNWVPHGLRLRPRSPSSPALARRVAAAERGKRTNSPHPALPPPAMRTRPAPGTA
jgi:hypothetical protein